MPGIHIGEVIHTVSHYAEIEPPKRGSPVEGAANDASIRPGGATELFAFRPLTDAPASHSVLRLRGGGGSHGKGRIDGDDERLLHSRGGRASYDVREAEIQSSAMRAAHVAERRRELQARLDRSDAEMTDAAQKHRLATDEQIVLKAEIGRLEQEKAKTGPHSPRSAEIDTQLRALDRDYRLKLDAVIAYQTATVSAGREYFRTRRELESLPPA